MMKSEVYSWRLSLAMKSALEEAARQEHAPISTLLERIVTDWLAAHYLRGNQKEAEQQQLHAAAARTFGTIQGANPSRSGQVRQVVRARLTKRHAG